MRHDTLHAFSLSRRLTVALALSGTALAVGTVGYMLMSGLSFVGALYQTVITLTTVGFSPAR